MKLDARFALRRDEPMSRHTSFHIGGPADYYLRADSIDILEDAVTAAWEENIPCLIFSGGSNVLVADAGIRGLVIENRCRAHRIDREGETEAVLTVESGATLPTLSGKLAKEGWAGLEWAVGVPGSVGGAVVQNAGAWGHSIADVLIAAELLERGDRPGTSRRVWRQASELQLAYRNSRLREMPAERRPVVLRARIRLQRGDLKEITRRVAGYVQERTARQPRQPSAGSIFRNPPGDYAGRLIEAAGLKGHRIGDAQISPQHANFIVNLGRATAEDVWALVKLAQAAVAEQFGIVLEPEIERIGEWEKGEE
jgi:UDP-N-acetylmuramate dehydrogenase